MKFPLSVFLSRAIKQDDTTLEVKRKKLLITISCLTILPSFIVFAAALVSERYLLIYVSCNLFLLSIVKLFLLVGLRMQPTDRFLTVNCIMAVIPLMVAEVDVSAMQAVSIWPMFVVVIDILLTCEAPQSLTTMTAVLCSLFLTILTVEKMFRFGLFDFEFGYYTQANRFKIFDCDNLPCKKSVAPAMSGLAAQLIVFILDFACTRGFARAAIEERNHILASIHTANRIAVSLSRFDLESSEELLRDSDIPVDLKSAFHQILSNLKSYKPYLPGSCFPFSFDSPMMSEEVMNLTVSSKSTLKDSVVSNKYCLRKNFDQQYASLLIANVSNSSSVLCHSLKMFSSLVTDLIALCSEVIDDTKGTLDLFLGDLVFVNFGACRLHRTHAHSCVSAARVVASKSVKMLEPYQAHVKDNLKIDIGMASGKLFCGDLGSETVMRFSVIGDLPKLVWAIERAARIFDVQMLSDEGLWSQVKHTHECRVYPRTILHRNNVHLVFEVLAVQTDSKIEWMYELENVNKWEEFNKTAISLLRKENPVLPRDLQGSMASLNCLVEQGPAEPLVISL